MKRPDGKTCTAVYDCEVGVRLTIDEVRNLYPRAYGDHVDVGAFIHEVDGATRWHMLVANENSTTRADVVVRIKNLLKKKKLRTDNAMFRVVVILSTPRIGRGPHAGSPRTGTVHTLKREPRGRSIAAR